MKTFNTTGPCDPAHHYQLPPLERVPTLLTLLRQRDYVALSGPRQSGKTSTLQAAVEAINADGWGRAVLLSCEVADQQFGVRDVDTAERKLIDRWTTAIAAAHPAMRWPTPNELLVVGPGNRIGLALLRFAEASGEKPLVVVLDEVDCLAHDPFGLMLRQIRDGFQARRAQPFPHGMVLAGMRSLRDHDVATGGSGTGSPFNIVHYASVGNFTRDEVVRLYAQHTAETGQAFSDEAVAIAWEQTRGQPLLVNSLAHLAVSQLVPDRSQRIEASHVEEAVRLFESSNPAHLTSLAARLAEDRVMNVVAPVVVGDAPDVSDDDERYVVELGILDRGSDENLRAANPIYARALLKLATNRQRKSIMDWAPTWLDDAGRIDPARLRENFLAFWALHRDMMKNRIHYPEAVAHFGLMTYLDRVANGGGRVDREYAVGRGKLDLLLVHGDVKLPIEVKVHRSEGGGDPTPKGLEQLDRYCEGLRLDTGWLVVFDQRKTKRRTRRLEHEEVVTPGGRKVFVVRA